MSEEGLRRIRVIGIGSGDPEHVTLAAVRALRTCEVFFLLDKGARASELTRLRRDLVAEHAGPGHRVVEAADPWRDRSPASPARYQAQVVDWRHRRADVYERLIRDELEPGRTGAFLVWGDPALYDSTIDTLEEVSARGAVPFTYDVIPGVSSISVLAARHRTTLTRLGRPVRIAPGRQVAGAGLAEGEDVAVMLDVGAALTAHRTEGWWMYWGAYVGTPEELLVSGPLDEVADRVLELRAAARERHGWIMDACLLRADGPGPRSAGAGLRGPAG
ncbi:precorrin-6A synthase (deacetylating) [Streptomyces sp. NPDC093589]|uniref:precorrin-6A synthase (deacetylating) n=1 Tax=Streptomyces sp. NPDC093589 TaxID=3366043 RepID=UPI00381636E4